VAIERPITCPIWVWLRGKGQDHPETAPSKRTVEIDEFVEKKEIDELYMRDPYYIVPDGEVGQQAFAVIREAIRKGRNKTR
jgi:non-homologous end joining protein Ku